MNGEERPVIYNPQRVIEHVQTLSELTLVRLFAVLFPLWGIETTATQEQGRPYELVEQYVERGIYEGQLCTAAVLADFFRLEIRLVEKILAFLMTIGHVSYTDGGWSLTPLGIKSVRDGEKYTVKETRRKLYFEGFYLTPLLREHYGNGLHILTLHEALKMTQAHIGHQYQFHLLSSLQSWNPAVLNNLENRADRARYNLPEEVRRLQPTNIMGVYLPMYIVETRRQSGSLSVPYYLVYTHIRGRHDEFFEGIVNKHKGIHLSLAAEKEMRVDELWSKWLASKGLARIQPIRLANGMWQVILPPEVFQTEQSKLSVAAIGTYHLEHGYFLQIWCEDEDLRCRAALDRTLKIIKHRQKSITSQDIDENLQRFAQHLHTRNLELSDVRQRAADMGSNELLSTIDAL